MRLLIILTLLFVFSANIYAQDGWKHGRLQVSANGHYLQYEDGTPFFWLGDTGWELFHRLKMEEINDYLTNRSEKGFNVIQAVVLAEFDGLRKPDQYGETPLKNLDPTQPNEKYFRRIDTVMQMVLQKNMFMALLPTWGDKVTKLWGEGPVIFNETNAYTYGLWIGKRYKVFPNIIWVLGGDRPAIKDTTDYRPIWRAMAKGIKEGTEGKAIFTYHPAGGDYSTSQFLNGEQWLDINMMQSGHGSGHDVPVWNMIERDRKMVPAKPTLDGEPNYEDHPVNPWPKWDPATGYYSDYDVRKQTYRSVFAGACGVTYGHHSIWQFYSPREEAVNFAKMYWTEAINRPGAFQMGYLRKLVESRPMLERIPDQSVIVAGQAEKGGHIEAFRAADGGYGMVYLPIGKSIVIDAGFIKNKKAIAWWFNPKNGEVQKAGTFKTKTPKEFAAPTQGTENDWVLVVDNPSKHFGEPGKFK